jgi:hypothetical protein
MKKRKSKEIDLCLDLEKNMNSMQFVFNCLESISTKCQTFFNQLQSDQNCHQFNAHSDDQQFVQLFDEYKRLKRDLNDFDLNQENDDKNETQFSRQKSSLGSKSKKENINKESKNENKLIDKSLTKTKTKKSKSFSVKSERRDKRYFCDFEGCDANFHSNANLLAHSAKHTKVKAFSCEWPGI